MENVLRVLLSFVGYRDPHPSGTEENGPVLSLLGARAFDRVVLFCTGSEYLERARSVEQIVGTSGGAPAFTFVNLELASPVDYEEIYVGLRDATRRVVELDEGAGSEYSVLLDPGTPQMQTSWFLLVRSGELDATLLQGIPARFAGGTYKVKEVRLDDTALPRVTVGPPAADILYQDAHDGPDGRRGGGARRADKRATWINTGRPAIVGRAKVFIDLLDAAARVARYDVTVLLRGETGSGKGLIARLIHQKSERAQRVFLPLNCSAITTSLAESELFGHAKGAFTGATSDRLGNFRAADGGTIFLDEIGDLPLEIQPKLLRVLDEGVVIPVGEDREYHVDVRVIAATNKDLEAMIASGEFRRDLYERLAQMRLTVPALRERPNDVPLLIETFLEAWNTRYHEDKRLTPAAIARLSAYDWPGNVRELENAVIAMCASSRGELIDEDLLPRPVVDEAGDKVAGVTIPSAGLDLRAMIGELERAYYHAALEAAGGNAERAASLLGVSGHAFRKAMRERFGGE
ncbi:MAG: AAA family ATPase [Spirochaetaceae bacterium]|nr:MAG: AAA family ATPase [Spirochaetaceae bacterium]